jgi:hypothetical protein
MKVQVDGWASGYPYAFVKHQPPYHLGEYRVAGIPLPGRIFGVDSDLARAEELPIHIHNTTDAFRYHRFTTYPLTALAILTVRMLPDMLKHPHNSMVKHFPTVSNLDADGLKEVSLNALTEIKNKLPMFWWSLDKDTVQACIPLLEEMIKAAPEDQLPEPRDWRISPNGILEKAK